MAAEEDRAEVRLGVQAVDKAAVPLALRAAGQGAAEVSTQARPMPDSTPE